MTVYFLVDDNNLVVNIGAYPDGMVPNEVSSNWLSTEKSEKDIAGKVYNSTDKTFSEKTGELKDTKPVSQLT